jgi:hypothetical protein
MPWARQVSQDGPVQAGFPCHKTAILVDKIKQRFCGIAIRWDVVFGITWLSIQRRAFVRKVRNLMVTKGGVYLH